MLTRGQPDWQRASKIVSNRTHVLMGGTATDLQLLLREWDNGRKENRLRILKAFVAASQHKTGPELEMDYGNGASLLLTRMTAWLRLTYLLGIDVALQLRAISIFVSAASGHRFLTEFLEVGGVLTILEILNLDQLFDEDKIVALQILHTVANTGRSYKELVCEVEGVPAVLCALGRTSSEELSESVRLLLITLGRGNPDHAPALVDGLLATLISPSALAQRVAAQTLRTLLEERAAAVAPGLPWVAPALCMLRTGDLQAQYEAFELLKLLAPQERLALPLLANLVYLLKFEAPIHLERSHAAAPDVAVKIARAIPAGLSDLLQEADAFARDSDSGSVAESYLEDDEPQGMNDSWTGPDEAAQVAPLYAQQLGTAKALTMLIQLDAHYGRLVAQAGGIGALMVTAVTSESKQANRQALQAVQMLLVLCPEFTPSLTLCVGGQENLDMLSESGDLFLETVANNADLGSSIVAAVKMQTSLQPNGGADGKITNIEDYWRLLSG
jgi:hypothetical protein